MLPRYLLALSIVSVAAASYCGQAAIPFTFQSLRSGHPVLGCARPRCFGWSSNGTRAGDTAQFYRVHGKEDGYLRRSDEMMRLPSRNPNFVARTSKCESHLRSSSCVEGEWVGGIGPQTDPADNQMQLRCCSYAPLLESEDRGTAPIRQGQVFIGGEVVENSRLIAFDYISDITKTIFDNGTIEYAVAVRRFSCFDESAVESSEAVVSENAVVRNLEGEVKVPPPPPTDVQLQQVAQPVQQNNVVGPVAPAPQSSFGQALQSSISGQQSAAPAPQVVLPVAAPGFQQVASPGFDQTLGGLFPNGILGPMSLNGAGFPVQLAGVGQQAVAQTANTQPMALPPAPQQMTQQRFVQPQQQPQQQFAQQPQQQFVQQPQRQFVQQQQQPQQQFTQQQFAQQPQRQFVQQQQPQQQFVQQQPQQQVQQLNQPQPMPLPTMAPLPKLEDLHKLDIPSVEDVENVIPPMERAILTNIAKFFGVL